MKIERFRMIVEAYGPQADRWPAAERSAAVALLASSAAAREIVAAAAPLDRLLSLAAASGEPAVATDRIAEAVLRRIAAERAEVAAVLPAGAPVAVARPVLRRGAVLLAGYLMLLTAGFLLGRMAPGFMPGLAPAATASLAGAPMRDEGGWSWMTGAGGYGVSHL